MKKVSLSIIGAGSRGLDAYANLALERPDLCEVVAVAEPRDAYRNEAIKRFGIPQNNVFRSWEEFVTRPRISDAVIICTGDNMHTAPALACIDTGYDILLEKPIAPTAQESRKIVEAALQKKCIFAVGHVLRYTKYFRELKKILDSGTIGKISNIRHIEGVLYWHYAHSYVRGNWNNTSTSSPMLLAKCCHDVDILLYLTGKKCLKVGSFGGRSHFCRTNQPKEAAERCLDCKLSKTCLYSAPQFYLSHLRDGNYGWPTNVIVSEFTEAAILDALRKGPYGRCVYACNNNVVEQQSVILEFEDQISATLTMAAFAGGRHTEIYGTLGEIHSDFGKIEIQRFGETVPEVIDVRKLPDTIIGGHGGGDLGLASDFVSAVATRDQTKLTSGPEISLESHLITFAAEESRLSGNIIDLYR